LYAEFEQAKINYGQLTSAAKYRPPRPERETKSMILCVVYSLHSDFHCSLVNSTVI